ncbi:unnamed protein product [Rhizophagus irregularis]|nr:unnamed protein product [Rhizophagus irregularis]
MEPIDNLVCNSEVPDRTYQKYWNSEVPDRTYQRYWNSEVPDRTYQRYWNSEVLDAEDQLRTLFSKVLDAKDLLRTLNFEDPRRQRSLKWYRLGSLGGMVSVGRIFGRNVSVGIFGRNGIGWDLWRNGIGWKDLWAECISWNLWAEWSTAS